MTPERIGGWGRLAVVIGIVLSIVWSGAMLYRGSEQMRAEVLATADDAKKSCEEKGEKDCSRAWIDAYLEADKRQFETPGFLKPGFFEAVVPVLVGWLTAYGIISATRWVAEGFRLVRNQREHSDRSNRDGAITTNVAAFRVVHNAGSTLLVVSLGFLVASWVAHHTSGFDSWADSLAGAYLWNFVLAVALYALVVLLLVGGGVVQIIGKLRRS
jgi:hypothetical protein